MSDTLQASRTVPATNRRWTQQVQESPADDRRGSDATAPVPHEFVHRPMGEDILITSWRRLGNDHFSVIAQWPHNHPYFTPNRGRHHPILAGETIRQAGLLVSHTEFSVPLGHHFILNDIVYTTDPEHRVTGSGPTPVTIDVVCSQTRMRAGALAGSRFGMTFRTGGRIVATGHSHVSVTAPAVYRRIRGERITARRLPGPLPAPVPAELTGSADESDVLLSPTGRPGRWLLRVAPDHPTVVNPTNDHVPGLSLLDAAQQAARALTGGTGFVPYAFGTEFHRYAEHGLPCLIEARRRASAVPGTTMVQVTGVQDGEPVFTSNLTSFDPLL
ncbi:ScbA/BarX family gamma-butyrolactone biosynthesis protein [Streptomyces sp. NPDC020883]|uniref:ScbA/BarX family gamma-butyrolactone biosynthesis protein n=1 Tax=unclassified Streptomyces TaxID=2593676 RepID=UPI0021B0ACCD|nr:ScbA/BarX family gamma-butyrolactone biosynthesis protein [Streptomyces sp. BHT-5-2]